MGVRKQEIDRTAKPKTGAELLQAVRAKRRNQISEVAAPRRKISSLVDRVTTNLPPSYGAEVAEYKQKIDALFQQRNHPHGGSGQMVEVVEALQAMVQQNNSVMAELASAVHELTSYLQRCDKPSQMSGRESTGPKPRVKK